MTKCGMTGKNIILNIIGLIFLITYILIAIYLISWKDYSAFLWGCYIAIPLMAIGIFKKNSSLILSQLIILAIPDILWAIDFFSILFTGNSVFGITIVSNFFRKSVLAKFVFSQHLYTIPLAIISLSFLKIKKNHKILLISLMEMVILALLTIFLAPNGNVNCLPTNKCTSVPLNFLPYPFIWIGFIFLSITISYLLITSLPFVKEKKEEYLLND